MMTNSSEPIGPNDLDLGVGHPRFLFDFWEKVNLSPKDFNKFSYYTSYLDGSDLNKLKENLLKQSQKSAGYLPNDQGYIVIGHGATHILAAIIWAMKKVYGQQFAFSERPHWSMFEGIANSAGSQLINLNLHKSSVNITTIPNNPNGKIINSSETDIADLSYCWPIYMGHKTIHKLKAKAYVFSFGKATGLVGLRLGWAMIHDVNIIKDVEDFLEWTTGGLSSQTVKSGIEVSDFLNENGGFETLCNYGHFVLTKRREELEKVLEKHGLKDESECGMFSFIKDEGLLKSRGIIGRKGHSFEVHPKTFDGYTRINIGCSNEDFRSLIERLK